MASISRRVGCMGLCSADHRMLQDMTTAALALDPGIFSPDAIDPETTAFNAQLASLLADVPPVWTSPPAVTRAAREEGRGPFGPIVRSSLAVDRAIPAPGGP